MTDLITITNGAITLMLSKIDAREYLLHGYEIVAEKSEKPEQVEPEKPTTKAKK